MTEFSNQCKSVFAGNIVILSKTNSDFSQGQRDKKDKNQRTKEVTPKVQGFVRMSCAIGCLQISRQM